jgi:uncharacterized protein
MRATLLPLFVAVVAGCGIRRVEPDRGLRQYIDTMSAIDSHAHPMAYVANGSPADTDYDALPLDGIPPFTLPAALRTDNPAYRAAQQALFGVVGGASGTAADSSFVRVRRARIDQLGERFAAWVLDTLHIGIMLANRVALGAGLTSPRFRWVAFVDPLMLPLDTRAEAARTADTKALYPLEAKLLQRYLHDLGLTHLPASLAAFQRDVVTATLERERQAGAVAIKFEAAYLRPLDFDPADSATAAAIYARYANRGVPDRAEYRTLENFLVRYIAREAGRLDLAVQIHSVNGFGGHYDAAGAAPHLLTSLLNDSSLAKTHFVIIHGGWPLVDETAVLLAKPNVYTDLSMMDQLADSASLVRALHAWLVAAPDKVMFGTDAFDGGAEQGWEQVAWVAAHNARRGLAAALEEMVQARQITPIRAREVARLVLHDNAVAAYRLGAASPTPP